MGHPTSHGGRHRALTVGAALLSGVMLLSACSGGSGGSEQRGEDEESRPSEESTPAARAYPGVPDAISQQRLSWDPCEAPTAAQGGGEAPGELDDGTPWQCATLTVPLDYQEPDGETIGIALIRATSTAEGDARQGSLIYNFGGPGGSGVFTLPLLGEQYETLREGYDLVSFDPRGVGESAGVQCLDSEEIDRQEQENGALPRTEAEAERYADLAAEYVAACEAAAGDVLPHLTTANTARDMDLMRHVLGDSRLHYFGISYGTELGGVYANLFPEQVGRAVLDAVVDPSADFVESSLGQVRGFQLALENFMADCVDTYGEDCPTGRGGAEGSALLADLLAELAEEPLETGGDRLLTEQLALLGIVATLYDQEYWEYLTVGLMQAFEGDGQVLLLLADSYLGRDEDGRYSNQRDAQAAITCADSTGQRDPEAIEENRAAFEEASPVFGPYLLWSLAGCAGWPVDGEAQTPEVAAEGAPEILLIGTTGDPATPYEGAERMQRELGEGVGVLLTFDGEGHGAYGQDACIDDAVEEYLLSGMVPQNGLVCG
ncbi:alpha/beta hydrolase [Streptomyces bohaiensis]|uniref:Alpha/beta hydrolase n=1 Tax=Streptomyces bohaiensis TaxID=1431344 RepID=A0ABX1C7G1_9ACTN|nr:alpha/beta hydrolase [Streptomyces bohaiensis]NJQ15105.1 alpha/beta hydrolase [Streptomyces bohaiensis]